MQNSQISKNLDELIDLVKWQQFHQKQKYDLMTIHSLILDDNPKFIYLKSLIDSYNNETKPQRIRYRQAYIAQLFKMLSQVSRIPKLQLQNEYLDKIFIWAQGQSQDRFNTYDKSSRPGTATTRTRPTTAYSRPRTANVRPGTNRIEIKNRGKQNQGDTASRPQTGVKRQEIGSGQRGSAVGNGYGKVKQITTKTQHEFEQLFEKMNKKDAKIDYSRLTHGQHQFYCGMRTLHPELQPPKKRLRQYQRNRLYIQEDKESNAQIIDLQNEDHQTLKLVELQVTEQKLMQEIQEANQAIENQQNKQGVEGLQGQNGAQEVDANVDDIPLEGEQAENVNQVEEEPEIVDKLRPRLKAYGEPLKKVKVPKKQYQEGLQREELYKLEEERKINQDRIIAGLQAEWAQCKGRAKSQMKRRAQSARIVGKRLGIPMDKYKKDEEQKLQENVVNFQNVVPAQVDIKYTKQSRPVSAFTSDTKRRRQQLIKNAFLTGRIDGHIGANPNAQMGQKLEQVGSAVGPSFVVCGQKPKKKTFQEILRQAQDRVIQQSQQQIFNVKEAFSKNKISISANRVAKSITHYQRDVDQWGGVVTGLTMLKNPFIKVAKKKKKKKKKN